MSIPTLTAEEMAKLEEQAVPLGPRVDGPPPIKVAICLPTHDMVPATFMYDLAQMVGFTGATIVADEVSDLALNMVQATIIQAGREELAQQALETGCTHLLWCDTDHRFPKDSLVRLLSHNRDIIGINYCTRRMPPDYVAFSEINTETRMTKKLVTTGEEEGFQEAAAIGFGLVMVKADVFWNMEKPWFDFTWIGPGADWSGEDVHFCTKARELGYKILVDPQLSVECSHTGQFQYKLDHAATILEAKRDALVEEKENGADIVLGPTVDSVDLVESDGS